ncbi:TrbM/KikA/MpfK family conjugal transfer protein [Taylorella equigenitalis]|uniref:IncQ plasmid conjugative transfer protein TraQ n=2 Tax=Taylorella equigenitalis TaxID=29575 RepID=A0A654KF84_TAYEM|nr:TrbM/KikA/MpfK family conjugal transfer protein [Taylorella equigenitalis]ADU91071.1 IncQ plasmid conjugative transfer protein TraQ [Taylorella equigenitalis MCE9]AFN36174.1 conjugal transfer protein TrbM [Taylorella equigenitalis ATCC 35865]ASY39580.1 conjugal transfer protein TraQ [Taylorella equigenitalis]ASY42521.1 conjugal transfer protein TraQ [Taylorella equigenitalis]KGK34091.1 conjugal transfer protein TraQ [Taylorella equigenitalis]
MKKPNSIKKKALVGLTALAISPIFSLAYADDDLLTGDVRLACEAILCLSSGTRPSECSPSLHKYFSIFNKKKPWKTPLMRIDFLNLCPASHEVGMASLIEAIAYGAGYCDANILNTQNRRKYIKHIETGKKIYNGTISDYEDEVITKEIEVIEDTKPAYCINYENHEWTDVDVTYIGDKFEGGKWADPLDREKVMKEVEAIKANTPKTPNNYKIWYTPINEGKRERTN